MLLLPVELKTGEMLQKKIIGLVYVGLVASWLRIAEGVLKSASG